jgi:hypothetical protein
MERLKNEKELELKKIVKEREKLEKTNGEIEADKKRIFEIKGGTLEREAKLSKREQEILAIENDFPAKAPEIPIPPVQLTVNSRKSWRDNIQKLVNDFFDVINKVYQSLCLKNYQLSEKNTKLTNDNEKLKNRAEKAEKDIAEKPINEIIADREKRRMVNQNMNNPIQHGNKSFQQGGVTI